ncbi:beta-ketoacyl-ACP synthase III [Aquifex aeolicus]|uniref:Beta-ketoacyl-[acyl-carrier-protein] synthase III n=1 Tax=Aquifex aeolicus (strain VF5) TaxID=224324 RepID=FABH_AQUAE|nr:beta-ketoacyl-ACP synthase III [Aquifex aeolicus]O67185.1 RecName: Full=Beta-ketoacyl-[acyl-carrier-protein] synthase III; Short=Beta-ketoacyl-ACP synthase III; Short=KAS III; AltName: Full=3-oxoacyl-[acyl-carrier-protein] synthase 3; AltName: Full=3-oxoacyl-[acyl-carrier-protein] synthase III [Aquifex aeolicus VF5]AAC07144.1 3-oxoacyl-[acyl-carrier-protein] synthase III [Aquifex aeolicus VF5]2EBD_A Chain A, 3-oxoacyl-[acyl-carrier-protein] synthase 3 [Aquifex aeolicus VF5]2EBD_B Chain B, 3-
MGTKIIGTGVYLPKNVLTNFDLEKIVDTSDEWITTRTGIKERRIAKEETITYMATQAAKEALREANLSPEELDLIILATLTPQKRFPSTACLVQAQLKAKGVYAFDISAACSGFIYALDIADSFIKSGKAKNVLVIGAEKLSEAVDWEDRSTCVLFGDGAGAVVVTRSEDKSDILATRMYAEGSLEELLHADNCGYIRMKGRELFKVAVRSMEEVCREVLEKAGVKPEEVSLVIPHQANVRIINALAEKLNIPKEKVFVNIQKYGNTSAASIPIALHEAIKEGKVKRGDLILMTAMGGGLTWGAVLLRY